MVDAIEISLKIARLYGRLGGNPRVCYRWLVERMAPDIENALNLLGMCRPFLISSTGRTGTTWLAGLLNQIPRAYVVHEPVFEEQYYHVEAFTHPERALPYLQNFRFREMAFRIGTRMPSVYGEVNGALRRHVGALRQIMPDFRIVHLVRDGRDVVTSALNTETYTSQDKIYDHIRPPANTMDAALWKSMDRFSLVCWMWAHENAYLREHTDHQAKFEDITTSYDRFREQILDPLGLELDEAVWNMHSRKRVNSTFVQTHPGYDDWTDDQKDTFWRLCESEMAVYGYFR